MPKYELMYILASGVSDDQVPGVTESVKKIVADFGGENIQEEQLGKKKLAYPIKKTRNGYYVVMNFDMDSTKVNNLDAKIRTQDASIIRYILVNLDEHNARLAKDVVAQAKMNRGQGPIKEKSAEETTPAEKEATVAEKPAVAVELNSEELDKKIEEALTEDLTK